MVFKIITIGFMIYILLNITVSKGINKNYVSRDTNNKFRGMFAVGILLHHISQQAACDGIFIIWNYVGFIFVSYFFFSSGYGLMLGVLEKKDYLKHFWKKRIFNLLIPYWIVKRDTDAEKKYSHPDCSLGRGNDPAGVPAGGKCAAIYGKCGFYHWALPVCHSEQPE